MKIGFNLLLWTGHVTEANDALFPKLKAVGFDGVEIPIFDTSDPKHFSAVGRTIRDNGLECTAVTVLPDEAHNAISADAEIAGSHRSPQDASSSARTTPACRPSAGRIIRCWRSSRANIRARRNSNTPPRSTARSRRWPDRPASVVRDRGAQPLRVAPPQHDGAGRQLRPPRQPSELRHDVRHLPREHRGEGSCRRHRDPSGPPENSTTSTFPKTTAEPQDAATPRSRKRSAN